MQLVRDVPLEPDALRALAELLGIMTDQLLLGELASRWEFADVLDLQGRLELADAYELATVPLGIDDVALLLDGMAFTEVASRDLPWAELVRWVSDFIAGELRPHWSEAEWQAYASQPG